MLRFFSCACSVLTLLIAAQTNATCDESRMVMVETAPESGARVFLLGADNRPADNIYDEQPYSDATGRRIAVRYYAEKDMPGGLAIVDLADGSRRSVLEGNPRFPAFHAWGEHLYYQEKVDGVMMLRRCRYDTLAKEDVAALPGSMGSFSYGAVSPDLRWYAVSVQVKSGDPSKVFLLDIRTGTWKLILDKPGYHAKHEQFSRDGRNRVLIQLNRIPDVKEVLLGEIDVDGSTVMFPADRPWTPRPTGHEAWIGETGGVFFSTGTDSPSSGNIWRAKIGDEKPVQVHTGPKRFGHVSVSKCGRYWIGDTSEEGVPVYIGSFASGKCMRVLLSRTSSKDQVSHTHPYLTADNGWLIFTSDRNGHPQVYGAKLAPGWLEGL